MIKIEDFIPELKELNRELTVAIHGVMFWENRNRAGEINEYPHWEYRAKELTLKKEQLLKPIFGL